MTETNPRPLHGLRVLDFSTTIAGPHCSRLLADMGADVIKVEAPEGDLMRSRPVQRDGAGTMFGQLNAGKRSIVLDLKRPESIDAIKKLVAKVDVVLENYRPGVMKRLGIDYPELAKVNPRLVYCAISGYGQTGPAAGRPAYAPVIHASTGYDMAHLSYQQGRGRPDNCGIFVADYASGAYAMGAILAALHQRNATGKGQMVDVSMFETLVGMLLGEVNRAQFDFETPSRPMYGPIEASDGYVMLATASERTFQDMATAAGRRDWLTDPRFEKYADRRMNWAEFVDEFEQWSEEAHGQGMRRGAGEARRALLALSHRERGAAGSASRASRLALHHRGQRRRLPVARPALPLLRLGPAKWPQGRRPGRAHHRACWPKPVSARPRSRPWSNDRPAHAHPGRLRPDHGRHGQAFQRTVQCRLLRRGGGHRPRRCARRGRRRSPWPRHRCRGGPRILSRHQPALRLAVRPLQQPAQERRQPPGRHAAAAALHPLRRQHAPVPGQPLRRGDRGRRDRAGADLRRRAAALDAERPQGRPRRSTGTRIPAASRRGSATSASAFPTRKRGTSSGPRSISIRCWRTPSAAA